MTYFKPKQWANGLNLHIYNLGARLLVNRVPDPRRF